MKKILAIIAALLLILAAFPMAASASNPVSRDGYYKGIKLAGKVKIVRNFGDIKIKEIVDYGEDFTVEIVNSFPDVRVEFVDSFPGVE